MTTNPFPEFIEIERKIVEELRRTTDHPKGHVELTLEEAKLLLPYVEHQLWLMRSWRAWEAKNNA